MAKDKDKDLVAEATLEQLVALVKAAQNKKHVGESGSWLEFLKSRKQTGGTDPKRHTRDVLEAFVADLAAAGDGSGAKEARAAAREFVDRYLKWAKDVRKDAAKGRGALPEPPAAEAAAAGHASTSASPSTGGVSVWSLVKRTRAHPKYSANYEFLPSYTPGWTRVKRPELSWSVRPRMFALDCEMCATAHDKSALLGVCVVDEFGEVVYRQLVRPEGKIVDLRTPLTGVSEADLEGVTTTAKDAQRAVRKLLEAGAKGAGGRPAVLVGHALYHDLQALRLDYAPVIDTSLLFGFRGLPEATPSLKDLAKVLLQLQMREGGAGAHDSREDAAVSMRLVMRELQLAAPTGPLDAPDVRVPAADLAKLCVHSLPEGVAEEDLRRAFTAAGAPVFSGLEGSLADKKVLVVFKHSGEANNAFAKLPGKARKDVLGRFYKQVSIPAASPPSATEDAAPAAAAAAAAPLTCKVRKMACHNGAAFGTQGGKRARGEGGDAPVAKKAKTGAGAAKGAGKDGKGPKGGRPKGGQKGPRPKAGAKKDGAPAAIGGAAAAGANGSTGKDTKKKKWLRRKAAKAAAGESDPVKEAGKAPAAATGTAAAAPAPAPAANGAVKVEGKKDKKKREREPEEKKGGDSEPVAVKKEKKEKKADEKQDDKKDKKDKKKDEKKEKKEADQKDKKVKVKAEKEQ
ncbi:hypothetical protein HXX76_001592 [Chlamydomonas incerta]|uniref:Exonuclease domain-containing protein n=1 Tax=Chlamydomonas incerta TaxID=51695 RepID=A0A835WCG8_CHLIN|nr:hypothetical protein HXX76_001592 [Chlamydomonas incerta]|eukprot:KAG2444851.1 hypothetical protein HXX76_001592 [Chlamydomonas incerta]